MPATHSRLPHAVTCDSCQMKWLDTLEDFTDAYFRALVRYGNGVIECCEQCKAREVTK